MKRGMTVKDFEPMAQAVMFSGGILPLSHYGVMYRTGRGSKDVVAAMRRALKNGNAKTENELGLLAVYLQQIFKRAI